MLGRTNKEIIDDIILRCSEKLDKQLYLFDNILGERETLSLLEDYLYLYVAGNILLLKPEGTDISNSPELVIEDNRKDYEEERSVILRYLITLIHFEINGEHDSALSACIKMLETTTRTFSREFLNVLYLTVLFDYDELYRHLCQPLAIYCVNIIYNEFNREAK